MKSGGNEAQGVTDGEWDCVEAAILEVWRPGEPQTQEIPGAPCQVR
jgi:hypothetical protein